MKQEKSQFKKLSIIILVILFVILSAIMVLGNQGNGSGPIENILIDNIAYYDYDEILTKNQASAISYSTNIFTSIHYIESPKGTIYDIDWKMNGRTVAANSATVGAATQGAIVFELDVNETKLDKGILTVTISSNGKLIIEKNVELR